MSNIDFKDDNIEVDLKLLLLILWSQRLLIASFSSIFAIMGVIYSLSLPNIYESKALLTPSGQENSLNSKFQNITPLTSFSGLGLRATSGEKDVEAVERIQSFDFFKKYFLPQISKKNLVASIDWDKSSNNIIYDTKVFDITTNQFIEEISDQKAYKFYLNHLSITHDLKTRFVTLKIQHLSPHISKKWLDLIINSINSYMKEIDKLEAENSINFLNENYQKTNISEVKIAITQLLESQIQTLMLTEATEDYIFKKIVSPIAPETKSGPSRLFISILFTMFGVFLAVLITIALHYFKPIKKIS